MREKLIELIAEQEMVCNYTNCTECGYSRLKSCRASMIADHLISQGVTIQEHEEIDFDYAAEDDADCDWCKRDWEVCGTCKSFFSRDEADRCAADPGEYGCAYYKPFGFCPKCGRKLTKEKRGGLTDGKEKRAV